MPGHNTKVESVLRWLVPALVGLLLWACNGITARVDRLETNVGRIMVKLGIDPAPTHTPVLALPGVPAAHGQDNPQIQ